jgi:hypothetical protein
MKWFLVFFLLLLYGCQIGSYEVVIRKANPDEALIKAVNENPDGFVGKEVEIKGTVDETAKLEWVKVSNCPYIYVKKAVEQQTFEYEVDYIVRGVIRYGGIPLAPDRAYIEAKELITKN